MEYQLQEFNQTFGAGMKETVAPDSAETFGEHMLQYELEEIFTRDRSGSMAF